MSKAIEPAKQSLTEYEMAISPSELQAVIQDNVGDQGISVRHLERITNPSGKSTKWEIPTIDGDVETTGEIEGVIVFHKLSRARWEGEYKGGGESPLCSSKDGFFGEGNPGGKCKDCPYAKFGENGEKPECRLVKQVFIRRPNELLPMVLNVTAVNLQEAERYLFRLLNKGKKYNSVVTKVHLTADKSKSGFDYAKTNFAATAILSDAQAAEMAEYTKLIKPMLLEVELTDADVSTVEEPDW
jgi:hypothetical protein